MEGFDSLDERHLVAEVIYWFGQKQHNCVDFFLICSSNDTDLPVLKWIAMFLHHMNFSIRGFAYVHDSIK